MASGDMGINQTPVTHIPILRPMDSQCSLLRSSQRSRNSASHNEADSILERITQQLVLGLRGKRFITGDFNQLHGLLQQAQIWAQFKWTEAQDLEFARTGKLPANTCKNSTKKDFIWISPELQPFWRSTHVDQLAFKDHAVASAHFEPLESLPASRCGVRLRKSNGKP